MDSNFSSGNSASHPFFSLVGSLLINLKPFILHLKQETNTLISYPRLQLKSIFHLPFRTNSYQITLLYTWNYYNINQLYQVAQWVKNLPAMQETQETRVQSRGQEDPLEEGMAIHFNILACRIPMDRGAWWATVHRLAQTGTRLKQLSTDTRDEPGGQLWNKWHSF